MHGTQRHGQACIAQAAHQAGRGGGAGGRAQRLDQQHLQQAGHHDLARGAVGARLVAHELHQRCQSRIAAHMQPARQQRHQQGRIGGTEHAMAHEHAHVHRARRVANPRAAGHRCDGRVDGLALARRVAVEAGSGKGPRRRDQCEVARIQHERLAFDGQLAGPLQHGEVEGPGQLAAAHGPGRGRDHEFGEGRAWLQQRHHLGQRIDHGRNRQNNGFASVASPAGGA